MTVLLAMLLALAPESRSVSEAEAAWAAGDYETAAARWADAYEETGQIRHVFARGQALAKLERCEEAIEVLEAFIATEPKEVAATAAQQTIDACRETLPSPAPHPPAPVVVEQPPLPALNNEPDAPRSRGSTRSWHRDPLGGALLGVGLAGVTAGATLAGVARLERSRASEASTLPAFSRADDRAVQLSRASVPVLIAGGAFVVGAVIRYVVVGRAQRGEPELAWYLRRW